MALGRNMRQGIGLMWRSITSAVRQGISTWDVVDRTRAAFSRLGISTTAIDTSVVDTLSAFAGSIDQAEINFNALDPSAQVGPESVSMAPWSMDYNQFNTAPRYRIRAGLQVEGQAEPVFRFLPSLTDISMPKQDLLNLALVNAQGLVTPTEGGSWDIPAVTGVTTLQITVDAAGP